jgi:hypothetical protein
MRKRPWQSTAMWGVESAPNRGTLEAHFDRLQEGKRDETAEFEMTCSLSFSSSCTFPPFADPSRAIDRLNSTVPATYSCTSPALSVFRRPSSSAYGISSSHRQLLQLRKPSTTRQAKAKRSDRTRGYQQLSPEERKNGDSRSAHRPSSRSNRLRWWMPQQRKRGCDAEGNGSVRCSRSAYSVEYEGPPPSLPFSPSFLPFPSCTDVRSFRSDYSHGPL